MGSRKSVEIEILLTYNFQGQQLKVRVHKGTTECEEGGRVGPEAAAVTPSIQGGKNSLRSGLLSFFSPRKRDVSCPLENFTGTD